MAVTELFEGSYGIAHEELGSLVNQSKEDVNTPVFGFIRTFNEVLIEGGSQLGDMALRTVAAPFVGGIAAVGQTAVELGMTPTDARRLVRDLYIFMEVSLAEIGGGSTTAARVHTRVPSYKRRARNTGSLIEQMEQAGSLDDFLSQFPTDQHAAILKQIQRNYEQGQMRARARGDRQNPSTRTQRASSKNTEIEDFVDDAISNKSRTNKLVINSVDNVEAVRFKLDTGLDLTGYRHIIDGSGIRHTLNAHGNSAKEAARGQIAISKSDFSNIPEIISNPDRIVYQGTNKIGRDVILYEKRIGNVY
jgi:hypothetical protein